MKLLLANTPSLQPVCTIKIDAGSITVLLLVKGSWVVSSSIRPIKFDDSAQDFTRRRTNSAGSCGIVDAQYHLGLRDLVSYRCGMRNPNFIIATMYQAGETETQGLSTKRSDTIDLVWFKHQTIHWCLNHKAKNQGNWAKKHCSPMLYHSTSFYNTH